MKIEQVEFRIKSSDFSMDVHERSSGLHISQIINALEHRLNKAKFRNDLDEEALEGYRAFGFMFERLIMETALKGKRVKRIGEVTKQYKGTTIYMSPDVVNEDDWELEEWKCTWRSMAKFMTGGQVAREFRPWLWQLQSYLYALNMDVCTLRVLWVNGDYGLNRRPLPEAYRLSFTKRELKENWKMLMEYAEEQEMLDAA